MHEPTLHDRATRNDKESRIEITATIYGELRRLAQSRLAGQPAPQTLQATALVNEAWLHLAEGDHQAQDRSHLFAAVAKTMRNILVDRARRRKRVRHGGNLKRVDLDALNWEHLDSAEASRQDDALLCLDDLLSALAQHDPETARLVELHYFGGLSVAEAATALELSTRTAERRLHFARTWLERNLRNP